MRKILLPVAASLVLLSSSAFAQGSGAAGDVGTKPGATTAPAGNSMSKTGTTGQAMTHKKMKKAKKTPAPMKKE